MAIVQDNIGTRFLITIVDQDGVVVLLDGATTLEFVFVKSDCSLLTVTPTETGEDGELEYATVDGDLNQAGSWLLYAHIVLSPIEDFRTVPLRFDVRAIGI